MFERFLKPVAAEQALKIAQAQGNEEVADSLRDRIEGYRQRLGQ